jgi:nucleotide-binding universal stress UspA family protein
MANLTILVPLDGSKQAELALAYLTALRPLENLHVRLLSVAPSDESTSAEEEARREALAADYLDNVEERTRANYDITLDCVRRTGRPHEEILEETRRDDVDLLLMSTHGHTITDPERLGSVADKVIRGAACPTLLIGSHALVPLQIEQITVPLDGSDLAAEALPVARALAEKLGSKVRLVQAVEHPPYDIESVGTWLGSLGADVIESLNLTASLYLTEAKRELESSVPVETEVLTGPPTVALMSDLQEHPPDLLVMGSHGRTGIIRWALGSVTDRMIRGPVPVLVLRPLAESERRSRLQRGGVQS